MYERYQVTSTRLHAVQLERSRVLDHDIAWHVIVEEISGAALMALSLEQAAAFAEALQDAAALIDDETTLGDTVVQRSAFFVVRAVPAIGAFVTCGHPRGVQLRMHFHHAELDPLAAAVISACGLARDLAQSTDNLVPNTFPTEWAA